MHQNSKYTHFFILLSSVVDPHRFQCPDPDPGSQTDADPCDSGSWSDFKSKQLNFNIKNIRNMSKHIPTKAGNQVYLVTFGQFPCSWIRIPNGDSNPGQPNQCGIYKTDLILNADHCCDRSERLAITIRTVWKSRQRIKKIASLK